MDTAALRLNVAIGIVSAERAAFYRERAAVENAATRAIRGAGGVAAENGAEALTKVSDEALVLLDMRMPVLDGWGFAQTVKARGLKLPIVVMTAAQDARRWAQEISADGFVAKPFDLLDLLTAVESALN